LATSPYSDTVFILDFLGRLIWRKPATVLDVGAGFGRWGFLCRCHMAHGESLTVRPEQDLRIEAIEAWPGNVTSLYDGLYDATHVGDASEVIRELGPYDIIICSHMLEHLEKDKAKVLLAEMKQRARVALILALPFGEWPQEAIRDNPHEVHRSSWTPVEFARDGAFVRVFGKRPKVSGVVIYPCNPDAVWAVKTLRHPWLYAILSRIPFSVHG
jgi:hypothetical protein